MTNKRQEKENKLAREYFKSLSYDDQQKIRKAILDNVDNPNFRAHEGLRKAAMEVLTDA